MHGDFGRRGVLAFALGKTLLQDYARKASSLYAVLLLTQQDWRQLFFMLARRYPLMVSE